MSDPEEEYRAYKKKREEENLLEKEAFDRLVLSTRTCSFCGCNSKRPMNFCCDCLQHLCRKCNSYSNRAGEIPQYRCKICREKLDSEVRDKEERIDQMKARYERENPN
jgi:hypothetical protein